MEWFRDDYVISTDRNLLQLDVIHGFLTTAYWCAGRCMETVKVSIENSECLGLYHAGKQVGFMRMVTDYATMYWLCDVFVIEAYRGRGLAKWMMTCLMEHPVLGKLNGFLSTTHAHGLYRQFGYEVHPNPQKIMIVRPVP